MSVPTPGTRPRAAPCPITVLRGHAAGVQAVRFLSRDVLLSGSQDGMLKVWHLARRRPSAEFFAHESNTAIQRLDILGSDKVVSQGRDGLIKVWDAERLSVPQNGSATNAEVSPEPLFILRTGAYHFCQFALVRWRAMVSTSGEGTAGHDIGGGLRSYQHNLDRPEDSEKKEGLVESIDFREEALKGESEQEISGISSGAFPDQVLLAPCEDQHAVRLWDLRNKQPTCTLAPSEPERKGMVMCARLLGDSTSCSSPVILCGHDSGVVCCYDVRVNRQPLVTAKLHTEPVLCIDIEASCRRGVSGSADADVHVFKLDLKKAKCRVTSTFHLDRPGTSCVEIRPDQKLFTLGGWDRRIRMFSWGTPRALAVLRCHEGSVYSIDYSPENGIFAAGSKDCRVSIWNVYP
ncbi:unnamed protein product [Choristocarpus tenellus]